MGDQGFPHAFHRSQVRILHGLSLGVHRLIGVTVVTGAGMTAAAPPGEPLRDVIGR